MIILVIIILATVFVASILNQLPTISKSLVKYDQLHLLPNYRFFAPIPYSSDFRVVYKIDEEQEAKWQELAMYEGYKLIRLIWNPFKYYNKGMIDTCQMLSREFEIIKDKEKLRNSSNHINIILSIYRSLKHANQSFTCRTLKFAIVTSVGTDELIINKVVFDSLNQNI